MKYLVYWKEFMVENDIWKKKDLENVRKLVDEFEGRMEVEVGQQERLDKVWKVKLNLNIKEFRRSELLVKYNVRILFRWDNKIFENKYLKKLERNQQRWKSVSLEKKP